MITSPEVNDSVIVGGFKKSKYTIKASPKTFHVLSSQLYRYPIRAVIRELCCNAADAHKLAQNPESYEVHFPTELEPYFSVKDNGVGIPHENIEPIFCEYFGSTKDQSNEFIGAFGLGSKSPYTVSSSFTVVSRVNGTKSTYAAFIDDQNFPCISLLTQEDTDELSGLEIIVPVKRDDIHKFRAEAIEVFKYLPCPKINIDRGMFKLKTFSVDEGLYAYNDSTDSSVCIVGGVAYPITTSSFTDPIHKRLISYGVAMRFDIGELSIAPSRESLSEDKSTVTAIEKRLDLIAEDLRKVYFSVIDGCESYYQARIKIAHAAGIAKIGMSCVKTYKGRNLDEKFNENIVAIMRDNGKVIDKSTNSVNIYTNETRVFVADSKYLTRLKKLHRDSVVYYNNVIYAVLTQDQADKAGLCEKDYTKTSTLAPAKVSRPTVVGYRYNRTHRRADKWIPVTDIPDGSVVLFSSKKIPDVSDHTVERIHYHLITTYSTSLYSVTQKSIEDNDLDVIGVTEFMTKEMSKKYDLSKTFTILNSHRIRFIDLLGLKIDDTMPNADYDIARSFMVNIKTDDHIDGLINKAKKDYPILSFISVSGFSDEQYKIFKEFFNASTHQK